MEKLILIELNHFLLGTSLFLLGTSLFLFGTNLFLFGTSLLLFGPSLFLLGTSLIFIQLFLHQVDVPSILTMLCTGSSSEELSIYLKLNWYVTNFSNNISTQKCTL